MLFNSLEFLLLYLPVTLAGYFLLNRLRLTLAAGVFLLGASLFFYSWWNPKHLPLIVGSILFNYAVGAVLVDETLRARLALSRRTFFWLGIAGNLVLLGVFKYADFVVGNINALFGAGLPQPGIVLPLGISFFTITQIVFLVDAYEGLVAERKLLSYGLFVTYFPHLLAGPILHHKDMMPQFEKLRNRAFNDRNVSLGLFLFSVGLFKKVIVADSFSPWVAAGFDATPSLNLLAAWAASLSYTFQIYFDFSGYSDMAIGLGLLFNIRLPVNFNSPYRATSIVDFWRRWHMTLTSFITTYVYTPILRATGKITFARSLAATFLAMLISGIWHGAGWTFIVWGAAHGAALVVNQIWRRRKLRMPEWLAWFVTFNFVNLSFVFFRARSFVSALKVLRGMAGLSGVCLPRTFGALPVLRRLGAAFGADWLAAIGGGNDTMWLLLIAFVVVLTARNSMQMAAAFRPGWRNLLLVLFLLICALWSTNRVSEFLYFRF